MPAMEPTGSIHRLEIENFKSYKGSQVIGPFHNFTAIIGPNGAGKSNLMDAISFVLGVRSMQLRGSQLKDLIYAYDDSEREKRGRKGHVKLVFIDGNGKELHLMRTITGAGGSEYRIDDKVVTWDQYNEKMKKLGILVKARNFLVFQGDLESVASKNPKELSALFEQISGSEELKKEYEVLEEKKARAEEETAFNYQKKKGVAAEKKQKKEQKEEAERHLELQEELKSVKTEYFLWQLFNVDRENEAASNELASKRAELAKVETELKSFEANVQERKKELALRNKEVAACEKKIAKKAAEIEKRKPDVVKFKEEMKRVHGRIEKAVGDLEVKKKQASEQEKEVDMYKRQLADIMAQLKQLSEPGQEGGEKLQLAQNQMNEYRRIKEEVGAKTGKLRQDRDSLQRQQVADMETLSSLEADEEEVESREKTLVAKLADVQAKHDKTANALEELQAELAALTKEETAGRDKHRKLRLRSDGVHKKLAEVENQLKDLKADRRESDRDIQLAENTAALKRLFPTVLGRISELCNPREKKYNLPVSIVMGKLMEAVVVDSERTAKDSIQYLREQRQPPMTFIPLDSIRVKPLQERLRTLGGTSKLLIDVIQYDNAHQNAFLYAMGNTLVCDSVEEARSLAWGDERHKVISLDGTLLSKGGAMTAGISGSMEAKSKRWDERAVEGLKQERDRLQKELADIPSVRDVQMFEHNQRAKIGTAERKITWAEVELKVTADKMQEIEKDLATLRSLKEQRLPAIAKLKASIKASTKQIENLDKRIHEVEDRLFRTFSESVGVASIREYEENRLKQQEKLAARKLELNTQKSKLESQLQFETRKDLKGPVEQQEKKIADLKTQTAKLREEASQIKTKQEAANKELEDLQDECKDLAAKAAEVDQAIQDLTKSNSGLLNKVGKLKREITSVENRIEQLSSRQALVLENCELEQIRLRTDDGESVPMDVDTQGGQLAAHLSQGFDYSGLEPRYRQKLSSGDKDKLDAEFKSRMEALSLEIERTAPNLKAVEQYEAMKEKERETVEEFEVTRKTAKELSDKFNAIKQDRYSRFMDAFNHISNGINQIYKELTQSSTHPLGGTAYLSLENEDEPFLGGIRYTAMPPTKRFRDMEQLSGGEKTVAALALLFAIHSFRPSPFFVLDEVDAALDNLNISKVAAYIRNKSRDEAKGKSRDGGGVGFQGVVISLKDQFYDKADALVGVYRDADDGCSRTLTFDLGKYGS